MSTTIKVKKKPLGLRLKKDFSNFGGAYLMGIPVLVFYVLFHYKPLFGALIAFKDYKPRRGIWGSPWVGFKHFQSFFDSFYFGRLIGNTLTISLAGLLFAFPIAIIFALLINEIQNNKFKRSVQTISYMPHFISTVVICSMIRLFVDSNGFIVAILEAVGFNIGQSLLNLPNAFVPIYVLSDIWQQTGWNCIIYLAALGGIDPELYEAARIDGANRWKQTLHVTLPGILETVVLLLILRVGSLMGVGHEKIILLYNDYTMETADVISSYVYRRGLINGDYSFSAAVGLFNSAINFALVVIANKISNKVTGSGIF
ncbi:MAG: sugar ABC transporter permease [Clostridia bacterium]|nr:sugar ABC transporter permease [Clostridia bacterium]